MDIKKKIKEIINKNKIDIKFCKNEQNKCWENMLLYFQYNSVIESRKLAIKDLNKLYKVVSKYHELK